jgi:hypothetical protein
MIMAESLAELQGQLIELNRARARGVRQITYTANNATRVVEYKSDTEMREAQNDLLRRITALQNSNASRTVRIASSKGFDSEER